MKKKIILLFIFFALPIPISMFGSLLCFIWFMASVINMNSFVEILTAFVGIIVGGTYIITYLVSLNKTWKNKVFSNKTFLPAAHCLLAFIFLLLLKPIGNYVSQAQEYFGFAKKDFNVIEEIDTHGGFLGDGSYSLILDCSENREEALKNIKDWNKLPMSENIDLVMYGGEKGGMVYGYNLAEEAKMPKIENGYYYFQDRHTESTDKNDDVDLLDRYSFNFSVAVYDCDTDIMYYFDYDT